MAIVSDSTTATGYGQPPAPAPAPLPALTPQGMYDYQAYSDPYTALPGTPGYAAPLPELAPTPQPIRDPNNPNVVWNDQYQRWYDTTSGLWRDGLDGVWTNWDRTYVWDPGANKLVPVSSVNIVPTASTQGGGVKAADVFAALTSGQPSIVATPDYAPPSAFSALSPDSPAVEAYDALSGMFQGAGTPPAPSPFEGIIPAPQIQQTPLPGTLYFDEESGLYATGNDATGWEWLTKDELDAKYGQRVVQPNIGPEVGAALDLAYSNVIDAAQRSYRLPGAVTQLTGSWLPYDVPVGNSAFYGVQQDGINAGTLQPVEPFMDFGGFQSLLPDAATSWLPNPDWLPLESTVEFATSPYGAATYGASVAAGLASGGLGAAAVGSTGTAIARAAATQAARGVAANAAGDLLGNIGANYGGRLPEPLQAGGLTPFALGLVGGALGEGYALRSLDNALTTSAGKSLSDLPPIQLRPDLDNAPSPATIDLFTGRDVNVLLPDGSKIPGVDFGPGMVPNYRAVQLPDGSVADFRVDNLEHLAPRTPLSVGDQVDNVLGEAPVEQVRQAFRYPVEDTGAPAIRPASAVDDVRANADGDVLYKGEVVGRVAKGADGRWQAIDLNGEVKIYGTKKAAIESIGNDIDVARGLKPVTSLVFDTRRAVDLAEPARREIADAVAAAAVSPNAVTITRANTMAFSAVNNVDHIGFNLADIAYVLGRDAEGNPITVKKLLEYRAIDEKMRNGIITRLDDEYRVPKDLLNDEYKIRTGGVRVKAKGKWTVEGGRSPGWLVPKGARDTMYDTRELQQAALREVGMDSDEIRAVLPEGPGLRSADGRYLHGSLLSYMNAKDWRKTLELERAALNARNHDELVRLKLEQAKVAGVSFNPFDPRTSYGLFSVADNAWAKAAAKAAVKDTAIDMATEGSVSHTRALKAAVGSATPVEMLLHEAETAEIAERVLKATPEAVVPTSAQLKGLVEATTPEKVTRTATQKARTVATEAVAAPFVGMRSLLLAGDSIVGRQLWGAGVLYPKQTVQGIVTTLKNVRARQALWDYVEQVAKDRPHLAPYLLTKGTPGSLEEAMTVGRWVQRVPGLNTIEDINGLMKNLVRINLDTKLGNMSAGLSPEQIAARANYIGVITGRGSGKFLDNYAGILNSTLFISSRYTASRFQFWGLLLPFREGFTGMGINALNDPKLYRAHMARMMAASAVAATAFTLLSTVPGVEAVTDSRSSKFGKFKWRDQWYDFTGAFTDPIRLFTQMATLEGMSETGTIYKFDNPAKALQSYIEARMPPLSRFIAERAGYVSPFQEKPLFSGQPGWMNRYIPLPVASLVEMWKQTNDASDGFWNTINTGATLAGFGVNPIGERAKWENAVITDKEAQKALQDDIYWKPGSSRKSFDDLSKTGLAYVASRPDIFGEKPTTNMADFRLKAQQMADGKAAVRSGQLSDDWKLDHGNMSPKDWRKSESVRGRTLSQATSGIYGEFEADGPSTDVVDRYYDAIDAAEYQVGVDAEGNPILEIDWEAVERWRGKLTKAEREQLDEYQRIQSGKGTEKQQEFDKARNIIDDSGFWTLKDTAYAEWRKDHPELPESYDKWREQTFQQAFDAALKETGSQGLAYNEASKAQSALEREMGFTDAYKNLVLYPWVTENPKAAKAAIDWQYYTPDNPAEKALFGDDATDLASSQQEYAVKSVVTPLLTPAIATAWQGWAAQNLGVSLSDGRGPGDFQTVQDFKDAYAADLEAAKKKETGRDLTQAEKDAIGAQVGDALGGYIDNTKTAGGVQVRYVNSSGKSTTGYLSRAAVDELDAIVAAYKQNPDMVKRALEMGIIKNMGTMDKAYLAQRGVTW